MRRILVNLVAFPAEHRHVHVALTLRTRDLEVRSSDRGRDTGNVT
jgi:hypothetical protein